MAWDARPNQSCSGALAPEHESPEAVHHVRWHAGAMRSHYE